MIYPPQFPFILLGLLVLVAERPGWLRLSAIRVSSLIGFHGMPGLSGSGAPGRKTAEPARATPCTNGGHDMAIADAQAALLMAMRTPDPLRLVAVTNRGARLHA
jgi:hypothetical protein